MIQKILLSVVIILGAIACFYYSIISFLEMVDGSSETVTTAGKSGSSSLQIWQMFSLSAFIIGLGLVAFLKQYWKSK